MLQAQQERAEGPQIQPAEGGAPQCAPTQTNGHDLTLPEEAALRAELLAFIRPPRTKVRHLHLPQAPKAVVRKVSKEELVAEETARRAEYYGIPGAQCDALVYFQRIETCAHCGAKREATAFVGLRRKLRGGATSYLAWSPAVAVLGGTLPRLKRVEEASVPFCFACAGDVPLEHEAPIDGPVEFHAAGRTDSLEDVRSFCSPQRGSITPALAQSDGKDYEAPNDQGD